ncbi:MAG: hypothetical protein N2Z63_03180 [Thiobacillaceae bacterium]|nr:hypothetical protein [Thiobacillaceae bacterium]
MHRHTPARRTFLVCSAALLATTGFAGCTSAPAGPRFSEAERKAITEYFARQRGRGPVEVPAQTVKAGGKLGPGPRRRRLPRELEEALPALAAPYLRLVVNADVALVNTDTDDILDVIPQVAY